MEQTDKKQTDKSDTMMKVVDIVALSVCAGLAVYLSNKLFDKLGI